MKKTIKKPIHLVYDTVRVFLGFIIYKLQRKTPLWGCQAMIRLFCNTKGWSNDILSGAIAFFRRPYELQKDGGVLSALSPEQSQSAVAQLKERGFYIFPFKLSGEL